MNRIKELEVEIRKLENEVEHLLIELSSKRMELRLLEAEGDFTE